MKTWLGWSRIALSVLTVLAALLWLGFTPRGDLALRYASHAQFFWVLVALGTQTLAVILSGAVSHRYFSSGNVTMRLPRFLVLYVYQNARALLLPAGSVAQTNPLHEALANRHSRRRITVVSLLASAQTLSVLGLILTVASLWLHARRHGVSLFDLGSLVLQFLALLLVVWVVGYPGPLLRKIAGLRWATKRFPRRHAQLLKTLAELKKVNINATEWISLLVITSLSYVAEILTFASCFHALAIPATLPRVLVGYLALQTALTFPVTPAGLIITEFAVATALRQTELSLAQALAVALIHRLVTTPYLVLVGSLAGRLRWVQAVTADKK